VCQQELEADSTCPMAVVSFLSPRPMDGDDIGAPPHIQIAMSFPTPPTLTVFTFNLGLVGELGGFRRSCVDPDDPVPS
jgi:hypothetical protein